MRANADYLSSLIEDIQYEKDDLEEKMNSYKVMSEDLEEELKEANKKYEKLLKENEKLKAENRKSNYIILGAFAKIKELNRSLADKNTSRVIDVIERFADRIVNEDPDDEE